VSSSTNPESPEPQPADAPPHFIDEPSVDESGSPVSDATPAFITGAPDTLEVEDQPERDSALLSNLDFDIPDDIVGSDTPSAPPARTEPRLDEIDFSSFFEPDSVSLQLPPLVDDHPATSSPSMPDFPALAPHSDEDEHVSVSRIDDADGAEAGTSPDIESPDTGIPLPDVIRAERRASTGTRVEPGEAESPHVPVTQQPDHDAHHPRAGFEHHRVDNEVDTDPDAPDVPALDDQHLDAIYGKPPQASSLRRTLWGLAVGLLAGTLAVQAIYLFRLDLARALPGLRPLMVTACERLGCEMPLPREAAQISIDTSDLQSEPGRPGRFVLHATVKNRADFLQAWPHLELTLTDAHDAALVRKVFSPAEWVADARIEAGFAPRGDAAVRLAFDVTAVAPTGYRVYVFYP
jgi:hypothetical protein